QTAIANEQVANQKRDEVRALNERLRHTLYAAHMTLAKIAWDTNSVERTLELLDLHRPQPGEADLRHFEWHYLNRLCHADLLSREFPDFFKVLSPDGRRVAAVSRGGTVTIWDVHSGRELLTVKVDTEA